MRQKKICVGFLKKIKRKGWVEFLTQDRNIVVSDLEERARLVCGCPACQRSRNKDTNGTTDKDTLDLAYEIYTSILTLAWLVMFCKTTNLRVGTYLRYGEYAGSRRYAGLRREIDMWC